MDTTLEVDRAKDSRTIRVAVQKQKDAEREAPMRFNLEKVADSLVLRSTVMSEPTSDFGAMANPVVELAGRMADERGGSAELKDLVLALMKQANVSDPTARRRINQAIPYGVLNAAITTTGKRIWREPLDSRNNKLGITIKTAG